MKTLKAKRDKLSKISLLLGVSKATCVSIYNKKKKVKSTKRAE